MMLSCPFSCLQAVVESENVVVYVVSVCSSGDELEHFREMKRITSVDGNASSDKDDKGIACSRRLNIQTLDLMTDFANAL